MIIDLVRHGEPEVPEKMCLGCRSNPGLSLRGTEQAEWLNQYFSGKGQLNLYSSPQKRAVETARLIARDKPIVMCPDLHEQDMGIWDGLSFREIRTLYPELYQRRGYDKTLLPPEAEPFHNVAERMLRILSGFDDGVQREVAAVSHAGAIRALLCRVMNVPFSECQNFSLPYGSVTELHLHDGVLQVNSIGLMPREYPDERDIEALWRRAGTPEPVIAHCRAVAEIALEIARNLIKAQGEKAPLKPPNEKAHSAIHIGCLRAAALLHDVCRTKLHHAAEGARLIAECGYPGVAEIVRAHHRGRELPDNELPNEADILFYADKIVSGTRRVSLEQRFEASLGKCATPEALQAHEIQKSAAVNLRRRIEALAGQSW